MKLESIRKQTFLAAILVSFSILSFVQDAMGAERYTRWILEHWVSPWITVPLATVAFVVGCLIQVRIAIKTNPEVVAHKRATAQAKGSSSAYCPVCHPDEHASQ
jgi:hypothetical protein